MKNTVIFLIAIAVMIYADAPWSPNVRVSNDIAWDTLDQGESGFDIFGDSVFAVCNTAQRGGDPNDPYAYSFDNGQSFIQIPFVDENAGSSWQTDPIVEVDDSGNIHMIIQFSADFMNHYFSRDGGVTWEDTSRVNSANGVDKPWWVIKRNEIYVVWQQTSGEQGIWLAKSTDWGKSFTDSRFWDRRGITGLAMDEEENLLLVNCAWSGDIYYRKSTDKGDSWTPEKRLASHSYSSSYGDRAAITSISASGDNVFITWVDNSTNNNWDVNGIRSADGGSTWETKFIVNDETEGGQCKGWALFDCYGGLHVQYYHTSSWPTNSSSMFSVRYRYSPDGGATFKPSIRITDTEWTSHADFMGEYHILRSDSQFVYSVWADGRNPDDNDLYFSKAPIEDLVNISNKHATTAMQSHKILSTPAVSNGNIIIKIESFTEPISINAYDLSGKLLKKLHNGRVTSPLTVTLKSSDLPSGIVFIKATGERVSEVREIMNVK